MRFLLFLLRSLGRWGLLASLLLMLPLGASASHIVGGELELQYLSAGSYRLTLNLYFDALSATAAATTSVNSPVVAGIFDKATNARITDISLPLTSNAFITYTNPACTTGILSTRKLVYTNTITLSAATYTAATGYYIAVQSTNRNAGIGNISTPSQTGQTFYLEFPAVVKNGQPFIDSTPQSFPALGDYACLGNLFYYDFSGRDADGDSLVYDMVTPLNASRVTVPNAAPYPTISWLPGYDVNNQVKGTPALSIDARSGRLTMRPTELGLFVFGVRCQEFRRGVKLGETRRDFQVYVLVCPQNAAPTVQVRPGTSRTPYRSGLDTLHFVPGGNRCITLRYTDPDANSTLTLAAQPVNYSGTAPTFSTTSSGTTRTAADTLTATLCFPDCLDTHGAVQTVDLVVSDNGCPAGRSVTRVAFTATSTPNTAPTLTTSFPPVPTTGTEPALVRLTLGTRYTATLTGRDADGNPLTLTATGTGFELPSQNMEFQAQNGVGLATGTFAWQPTCVASSTAPLEVHFRLAETGVCLPLPQERVVRFEVVQPNAEAEFLPPNVITPNADGKNDFFTLATLPPDFCESHFASVRIFSRWGQLVYSSPERNFSWGGAGAAGNYYYLLTYSDGRKYKGWLEVVR